MRPVTTTRMDSGIPDPSAAATRSATQAHLAALGRTFAPQQRITDAWLDLKDLMTHAGNAEMRVEIAKQAAAVMSAFASLEPADAKVLSGDFDRLRWARMDCDQVHEDIQRQTAAAIAPYPALAAYYAELDARAEAANVRAIERVRRQVAAYPALLLFRLRERGVELTVDRHGKLMRSAEPELTREEMAALATHRDAIAKLIQAEGAPVARQVVAA